MIDFSALVLAPGMAVFGREVIITPTVSQPLAAPYAARGVFTSTSQDVPMQDGSVLCDQKTTLDIRLAEFPARPEQNDRVTISDDGVEYAGVTFWIAATDIDGQGGMKLTLRRTAPEE